MAVAHRWLYDHGAAGIEGVVAKRLKQSYRSGRTGWLKIRTRTTAEAIIGGVIGSIEQPEALILGRQDASGRLRVAGCTARLSPEQQAAVRPLLATAHQRHPWPPTIPSSRFGQLWSEPVAYTPVAPRVVVELEVDTAFEQERWRHAPRFLRVRADLTAGLLRNAR
jgi:ATP-dependent DNA ligase